MVNVQIFNAVTELLHCYLYLLSGNFPMILLWGTKSSSKSHLYQKQSAALFSFFRIHCYSCLWKSRSAYRLGFDWTYHHRIALLWKSVIIKLSRYRIGKLEIDSSFCERVYFKFIFIAKFNEQPPWLTGSWCEFNKIFIRLCICLLNVL